MPHVTLEYTGNMGESIDLISTLQALDQTIAEAAGIAIESFKSRAVRHDIFVIGDGRGEKGFVHLEIAIFGGRSQATKDEIGRLSLGILQKRLMQSMEIAQVQLTVEIRELDRHAYYKSAVQGIA